MAVFKAIQENEATGKVKEIYEEIKKIRFFGKSKKVAKLLIEQI